MSKCTLQEQVKKKKLRKALNVSIHYISIHYQVLPSSVTLPSKPPS